MNKTLIRATCALLFSFLVLPGNAQHTPSKFGKISMDHLQAELCPIDSNAHAYYIFDYGYSYFKYDTQGDKGFQLYFDRHFRIKIVDKQGFDWANVAIPLYHDKDEEKAGSIKAFTYNLENGKMVKTKLERGDIHTEESSLHWNQRKFAMPNVKEGSVIEVEYTIVSDFYFNLREWQFQSTIPVLRSDYTAHIPEYFTYNLTQKGYFPFTDQRGNNRKTITFSSTTRDDYSGKVTRHTSNVEYQDHTYYFSASNIPAFPTEGFLRTRKNYLTMLKFELNRTNFPSTPPKQYTTTWSQVDKTLMESNSFGVQLSREKHMEDAAAKLKASGAEGMSLLEAASTYTRQKLAWNGEYAKYSTTTLPKAFKEENGNAADINLNLVVLLRFLGFESYPVILSTQRNGIIHPSHPSISSFNYVIAMARVDGEVCLIDATDPYAGINLLPLRCLNDKGRVIGCPDLEWINLMDYKTYRYRSSYTLVMDDDFGISGSRKLEVSDYAGYGFKSTIKGYNDLAEYEESLDERYEELDIQNLSVEGLDSAGNKLIISYDLSQEDFLDGDGDVVYFSPVFHPFYESNPFKLEKREYPVEFNHPYLIQQNYAITIPEGYSFSELPKSMLIKLPDNSAKFTYQAVLSGNNLMVYTSFQLKRSNFLPDEYENLKQFYQMMIDKQSELVVINKN